MKHEVSLCFCSCFNLNFHSDVLLCRQLGHLPQFTVTQDSPLEFRCFLFKITGVMHCGISYPYAAPGYCDGVDPPIRFLLFSGRSFKSSSSSFPCSHSFCMNFMVSLSTLRSLRCTFQIYNFIRGCQLAYIYQVYIYDCLPSAVSE
jgi:hypothetical protein